MELLHTIFEVIGILSVAFVALSILHTIGRD